MTEVYSHPYPLLENDILAVNRPHTESTLIVVLGMHRGGTSAITRAMETMGADFGANLGQPVAGENDKGFFEDLDIHRINVELLHAAGSSWDALAPVDLDRIAPAMLDVFRERATSVLIEKCRTKIFALKDPRISRLLPFWMPVFERSGLRIFYVIAIRNPISVARSLKRRDRFSLEKSCRLWLAHMAPAIRATDGRRRVFVDYDTLIDAPVAELTRVSKCLGLALNAQRVAVYAQEFLDNRLRHWQFTPDELDAAHTAPQLAQRLFQALCATLSHKAEESWPALVSALTDAEHYVLSAQAPTRTPAAVQPISKFISAAVRAVRAVRLP
ncbi:hypothetical protein SAMN05443245_7138 [Paraburkholderia fungorum]|uniref:Sulfotransferase family protein n=1 Tax=Paraburkholderia fungorum TaxID=134537 RepID=A0A1H1JQF7_9BURK|nr:hypothetical protein [Paraburkholderia fungorum]SDR52236.1 hypothetical protein SAMN05443245_7138 [Paraburkholderia fungorum]